MQERHKALVISIGFLVLSASASGQGVRSSFFLNGAAFFPSNDAIQNKVGQGLGLMLNLQKHIAVSFEWKYAKLKVDSQEGGLMNSELSYTPLVLSISYHPVPETRFSPYAFLGVGLYLIQLRPGARLTPEEAEIRSQKVKDGIGLSGGFGTTFRIGSRLFLYLEGLYLWRKAKVETLFFDDRPSQSFTSTFSSLSALVGLKIGY